MSAARVLDDLARALVQPMPRRRALRLLGASIVGMAVPAAAPRVARGAPGTARAGECRRGERACPTIKQGGSGPDKCCGSPFRYVCGGTPSAPTCDERCPSPSTPCPTGRTVDGFAEEICCSPPMAIGCCKGECIPDCKLLYGEGHTPCCAECCNPGQVCENGKCVYKKKKVCGPDVTQALDDTLSRVKTRFAGWGSIERNHACQSLVTLPAASFSWDINQLSRGGREPFAKRNQPECSTCGHTVQVGGDCHYSGSVNYVLFGVMMRLCHDHYSKENSAFTEWFSWETMNTLIYVYKSDAANFVNSLDWANTGYNPSTSIPRGDRRQQCDLCPKPYSGRPLTFRWFPLVLAG